MEEFPHRRVLCVGAVVLKDERMLFVRQTYGESLKGKWSIPWGYVDANDTPDEAAVRESLEEAGIEAQVVGLLGVQNHIDHEGNLRLYLLYLCHHVSGEPTPDNHETDAARYFSERELEAKQEQVDEFCYWLALRVLRDEHGLIASNTNNPYRPYMAFL